MKKGDVMKYIDRVKRRVKRGAKRKGEKTPAEVEQITGMEMGG